MSNCIEVSAIILSGGRGSRMQGRDKGLLLLDGKPLVQHVIERIAPQVDDIVISANRSTDAYAETGCRVVSDLRRGFEGPLAGIQACLPHCRHERVLVVACDMPYLPKDLVSRLSQRMNRGKLVIVEVNSRLQPAFVMDVTLLESIVEYLARGQRSLMGWIEWTTHDVLSMECTEAFTNINRPEQLDARNSDTF